MKIKKYRSIYLLALIILIFCASKAPNIFLENSVKNAPLKIGEIPQYSGSAYVEINDNIPFFTDEDYTTKSFEKYSELDRLNRCGVAFSNIGFDLMPTEEREYIGQIKPSGWQISKYDFVDGKYLYNRCHLIGFQLTGENANEKNLITGTRYLNVEGMLHFENMVADYIKETKNHVLYRVTPVFEDENLIASGVLMEARSVEDNGVGICFNVYCYNVQPGVKIDYSDGNNRLDGTSQNEDNNKYTDINDITYIANKNSRVLHRPDCKSLETMKEKNKKYLNCDREDAIKQGFTPCGACKPWE